MPVAQIEFFYVIYVIGIVSNIYLYIYVLCTSSSDTEVLIYIATNVE